MLGRPALVLTDLQRDFIGRDGFLARNGRALMDEAAADAAVANCRALIDAAHRRGVPVIVASTLFRPDHLDCAWASGWAERIFGAERGFLDEGTPGAALIEGLGLTAGDFTLIKKTHGAFTGTTLDRLLANLGVDTLLLAGGPLASSLSDTARLGVALGYRVYLASDAVYPGLSTYPLTTQAEPMATQIMVAELGKGAATEAPTGRRALVVVDMQRHFLFPGGEGSNESPNAAAIANVAALADGLRAQDCPIVWVKTGRRKDRADSALPRLREAYLLSKGELLYDGTWGSELAPGLNPRPEDILVVKRGNSAFNFTPLHRILRNLGVSHCVVTGGATTGCLAATVRDGAALGYRFTVASDAVYPAGSSYLKVFDDYGAVMPTAALLKPS